MVQRRMGRVARRLTLFAVGVEEYGPVVDQHRASGIENLGVCAHSAIVLRAQTHQNIKTGDLNDFWEINLTVPRVFGHPPSAFLKEG